MTYVTKRCPHCNEQLSFMEPKKIAYGSPFRTCPRCQKTYIDKSYREIAISGKPNVYPVSPFSAIMLLFLLFGLVAILSEYRGDSFLPICICTFFIIIFLISMIGDWKSYDERKSAIFLETLHSEQRLANPEYASALKELGYRVPEKYLYPKGDETIKGDTHYYIETPDGMTVRVPADNLDSWAAADHDAPLTPAEERLVKALSDSIYGQKPSKDDPIDLNTDDSQQTTTQKKQLEEIAIFRHDLMVNYAHGNISEQEFDDAFDCILQMESEAGISMLDAGEIDYERIYRSSQLKAEAMSQKLTLDQDSSKQKKKKASHRISLITIGLLLCICVLGILIAYKSSFPQSITIQNTGEYKTAPRPGVSLSDSVYISNNTHKIHTNYGCSGMKYFFKLSYGEACKAGYEHCDKCFDFS